MQIHKAAMPTIAYGQLHLALLSDLVLWITKAAIGSLVAVPKRDQPNILRSMGRSTRRANYWFGLTRPAAAFRP